MIRSTTTRFTLALKERLQQPIVAPIAETIDKRVTAFITNPDFLRTASLVINANSYRRKWTRAALQRALSVLELPVRGDQERMLALIEQLNGRIEDLETAASATDRAPATPRKKNLDVVGRLHVPS